MSSMSGQTNHSEIMNLIQDLKSANKNLERTVARVEAMGQDKANRSKLDRDFKSAKDICKKIMPKMKDPKYRGDRRHSESSNEFNEALTKFSELSARIEKVKKDNGEVVDKGNKSSSMNMADSFLANAEKPSDEQV